VALYLNGADSAVSCLSCLAIMSEQRSWAAIARPTDAAPSQPSAVAAKKCRPIIVPKTRIARSISRTPLENPKNHSSSSAMPAPQTRPALPCISAPFPTGWYASALAALSTGPVTPSADEPRWHRIFNDARKHLFAGAFATTAEAHQAGDEGLGELSAVIALLGGLNLRDGANAYASLQAHSTGQPCAFCK
jgi:hypothetical protein